MKQLVTIVVSIALLPAISYGQNLYFNILDSLNYNPTCLDIADFDGDGLDELFAGSDTGLLIINPRIHGILYYSDNLRERVTASAFFDADGDGTKDILTGSYYQGMNRLHIFYGPGYRSNFQWGGFINNVITEIYTGIPPDTSNIILACTNSDGALYSIDRQTWDYYFDYAGRSYYPDGVGFIPSLITHFSSTPYDPYGSYLTEFTYISSRIEQQPPIELCEYLWNSAFFYGFVAGNFNGGLDRYGIMPFYCPDIGMRLLLFGNQGVIDDVADTSQIEYGEGQSIIADDVNSDSIDDIIVFMYVDGASCCRIYNGANLQFIYMIQDISVGTLLKEGRFYDLPANMAYSERGKILLAAISTEPNSIEDEVRPTAIQLITAYPNPFNASTTISLSLPADGNVVLSAVNLLGQQADRIFYGFLERGSHSFHWNPQGLSSGLYFIVASSSNFKTTYKLEYIK